MTIYIVLCTTKQNNPFIHNVGNIKAVADYMCEEQQERGLFSVVVEKQLNQSTKTRGKR